MTHLPILTAHGRTGATFETETSRTGAVSIIFHSRGTTEGTRAYRIGLHLLLERLAHAGIIITEICVETRTTKDLSRAARRIFKAPAPYPTRASLGTAAAKVGRPPGAKGGGNGTKRLRIYVDSVPAPGRSPTRTAEAVANFITRG